MIYIPRQVIFVWPSQVYWSRRSKWRVCWRREVNRVFWWANLKPKQTTWKT